MKKDEQRNLLRMRKFVCVLVVMAGLLAVFACMSGTNSRGERGLTVEDLPGNNADIAVFPQLGHKSEVNSVAFSPNGNTLVSGSADNTIKLWDVSTGREIRILSGHSNNVYSVAFSSDGKTVISGSWDDTIKLWDVTTGLEIRTFSGHSAQVSSVAFSPDNKTFVSGSYDHTIKLWDIATGRENRTFSGHTGWVQSVAFSPDGKTVVSGAGGRYNIEDYTVKLWDVVTGHEIRTLSGHSGGVESVAVSPDNKTVVSGSRDGTIKLWNVVTGREICTMSGHSNLVNSVAFSTDGKILVSSSEDKTVKLWDVGTGREIRSLSGHSWSVFSAAFSPDNKTVVSGSLDDTIKLWDVTTGLEIRTFSGHSRQVSSVAFSPDGKTLVSGSYDKTIKLWDVGIGREIRALSGHSETVVSLAFSPDGKTIVSGSYDNTIKFWDASTGEDIRTLQGHSNNVNSVAFSPDGKTIASGAGYRDNTIKLWDAVTGREIRTLSGHSDSVDSVAFSPDGKTIVSGSYDKTIKLWDAVTGREIRTLRGHSSTVNSVVFSPDGKTIVSGSSDKTIKLWDVITGNEIRTLSGHSDSVKSVAFSPDNKTVVSGSIDNMIKLWDVVNGNDICTLSGHSNRVISVAFSPDGKTVVSGSWDSTTRIWNSSTGKEIAQFISFWGNDTQLSSASRGLTVEAQTAATSNEGEWLSITHDGYYQASPRGDRYLNVRVNNTVSGIDSYRSIFYNPDVVQARLQGRPDPASKAKVTIQQAASFTPPTVTIQSPVNFSVTNTATANLSVNITSQSQPVKNIKIIVNGRLIGKDELAAVKGTSLQSERASLTVTGNQKTVNLSLPLNLDPGPNRIEVVAFNGYSESRRYIDVTRNAPAGEKPALPNLWILAVGVNAYDNAGPRLQGLGNLNFCVADAKGLVDSLKAQQGKRYGKVNSLLIADGEAQTPTAANIKQGLKFLEGAAPRDVVVLFLAGHGISAQESKFFFLPKDAAFSGNKVVDAGRAISGDEIMSVLDAPGNRLVFIDACQSGGVDNDHMVRSLMDTNAFVFAASRGNELSYEDPKLGHGFFTNSVMSAIKGAPAALAQGNVTVLSMSGFVKDDVPKKTGGRQNPSAYSLGFYDFPMALIK